MLFFNYFNKLLTYLLFANKEYYMIVLKPQDIIVILKTITTQNPKWTYSSLSAELFMSASETHSAIKRLSLARLWDPIGKFPFKIALEEFICHGLKYAFPGNFSGITRGLATAPSAPPLNQLIVQQEENNFVWPDPVGQTKGLGILPLYKTVPKAVQTDNSLYELLSLIDAIRIGSSREQRIAINELKKRIANFEQR